MQQTNFTGFTIYGAPVEDPVGPQPLADAVAITMLNPAEGDMLLITGAIKLSATHAVDPTAFTIRLLDSNIGAFTLVTTTLDSGDEGVIIFQYQALLGEDAAVQADTAVFNASPTAAGTLPAVYNLGAVDGTFGNLQITTEADQAESETELLWATVTRVRRGIS